MEIRGGYTVMPHILLLGHFLKLFSLKIPFFKKISEDVLKKDLVFRNPKECYIPYQRWGRKDIVYKIPTIDLINVSDFIIDCKKEA